ncbi:SulP family inorganic anion transporter [Cellulomonas endometrii]|uniref:SulP family inorganic anion transporter n=1 Tax=Cellulomonas endometrii TaxID=3036301 RepID=UPI0024ADFEF3|nr:SulP family inorganic anion transporter [Cellulomonas endometrii]
MSGHLRALLPSPRDYAGLRTSWRGDLVAGLTVGVVALPLALAFGVSSGAGAEAGLVTAVVAGLVAAVFGGSNVQVSGPTGAMVVVLGPIVAGRGVGALGVVCLLAGVLVVLAGVLRLGRTVGLIPWPVIEGFTVGIAVIIFLQQVPAALGVAAAGHDANAAVAAGQVLGEVRWPDAAWSLATAAVAAVMLLAPRVHRALPGSIVAIVVVTVVAVVADLPLAAIGELPAGLPAPELPGLDLASVRELAVPAVTVAALAAIESLLSARVAAAHSDTGPYDGDRELVGQGLATIAAGVLGGMPATGAIARTAVNVRSGARTRLAAIVHAVFLLLVVVAAGGVVGRIPLAALAGVLMVTAARMVSPRVVRSVVTATRAAAVLFALTAVITVSVDLIYAVGIGIAAAAVISLRSLARAAGVHREELPGPAQAGDTHIALFRIEGSLFFAAAERVLERVAVIQDVDVVVLRLSHVQVLDAMGAQVLQELVTGLERRGVTVLVKGIRHEHLALARRIGVIDALRDEAHLVDDLPSAVARARAIVREGGGIPVR